MNTMIAIGIRELEDSRQVAAAPDRLGGGAGELERRGGCSGLP